MVQGIYVVQFANAGDGGAGLLVVTPDGKAHGGDHVFSYAGNFTSDGATLTGTMHLLKHGLGGGSSIFGPLNDFKVTAQGPVSGKAINLNGQLVDAAKFGVPPQRAVFRATMTKVRDLT